MLMQPSHFGKVIERRGSTQCCIHHDLLEEAGHMDASGHHQNQENFLSFGSRNLNGPGTPLTKNAKSVPPCHSSCGLMISLDITTWNQQQYWC